MRHFLILFIMLLAVQYLPAAIIYTHLAERFDANARDPEDERGYSTLSIDFNGDGTEEFVIGYSQSYVGVFYATSSRVFIRSSPPPNIGGSVASILGGVEINASIGDSLFRWYNGQPILENFPDQLGKQITDIGFSLAEGSTGHTRGRDGYLGFEFQLEDGVHYAWIHFDASANLRNSDGSIRGIGGYIEGWAWETVPGEGIVAGAIPEPSISLVAALLFSGLLLLRRRNG
jgi:hypothetical protein